LNLLDIGPGGQVHVLCAKHRTPDDLLHFVDKPLANGAAGLVPVFTRTSRTTSQTGSRKP
jgi:hypothetical protein